MVRASRYTGAGAGLTAEVPPTRLVVAGRRLPALNVLVLPQSSESSGCFSRPVSPRIILKETVCHGPHLKDKKTRPGRCHAAAPSSAALLALRTGSRALRATRTAPGTVWHIQQPLMYLLLKLSCRPHDSWRWGALL